MKDQDVTIGEVYRLLKRCDDDATKFHSEAALFHATTSSKFQEVALDLKGVNARLDLLNGKTATHALLIGENKGRIDGLESLKLLAPEVAELVSFTRTLKATAKFGRLVFWACVAATPIMMLAYAWFTLKQATP